MDYVNVANEIYFLTRLAKTCKGHVITKEESKLNFFETNKAHIF